MPQQGTQHHEHMPTGRNRIKATQFAWYWITHHSHMNSFQMADLCAASFDAHVYNSYPEFWKKTKVFLRSQNCTIWTSSFKNDIFLHTKANSCICVDNIKSGKRTFAQHNYCSWHTVNIKVHNIAPNRITHYKTKCKKLLMSQFPLYLSICKFSFPLPPSNFSCYEHQLICRINVLCLAISN